MSRETGPVLPDTAMAGNIAGYRLSGYIGRGGMAVVYLAQDERADRTVALKVLAPELARDAAFRTRFLHESQAASAVDHPNIIPVYEAGDAGGNLFVAMRYVQGGDARALLNRIGPLPFGWAWSIIAQVASALDAAHAHGLIHRDVKPTNMLLETGDQAGGGAPRSADSSDFDHVYLSDFGISKNPPPGDNAAALDQIVGTPDYVAPEQVEGRAVDGRADLYSLACAGFELLCGTPPFGQDQGLTVMYAQLYAPPPMASARRPDLPPAVDQVLATALAKNPADRYMTCGQFAEELHGALRLLPGGQDVPAGPTWPGYLGPVGEAGQAYGEPAPPTAPYEVGLPSYELAPPAGSHEVAPPPARGPFEPASPNAREPYEPAQPNAPTLYGDALPTAAGSYGDALPTAAGPYGNGLPTAAGSYGNGLPTAAGSYEDAPPTAAGPYEPAPSGPEPGSYEVGWMPPAQEQPPAEQDWPGTRSMNGPDWSGAAPADWAGASPGGGPQWAGPDPAGTQEWAGPDRTGAQEWAGQNPAGVQEWAGQNPAGVQEWAGQNPAGVQEWAGAGPAGGPGGGPPSRPGGPKQRPGRQPISRTRLIAAGAGTAIVVVAVAIAAALSLSHHPAAGTPAAHGSSSAPPSSTTSARLGSRQAAAVNGLLASSAATRKSLTVPIRMASNCRHLPRDVALIQRVANERSAEYKNVLALSTGAMVKGALVKADLLSALRHSLAADRAYLTWARQQLNSGCTPTSRSSAYQAAQRADGQADTAKAAFVQVWNSVAARYGVPQKSAGDI